MKIITTLIGRLTAYHTSTPYAKRLFMALLTLLLAACGGDDPAPPKPTPNPTPGTFTVTFNLNADDAKGEVNDQTLKEGQTANRPQAPTRDGYTFLGWFTDPNFENAFAFDTPITENVILYARWEQIPEKFWIPDVQFRNRLKSRIPEAFDDRDSLITEHEQVTTRTSLDASSFGIADLTGIAYFTALTSLNCSDNQLTSLDVSQNTALQSLQCHSNELKDLNISQNTALTSLDCSDNQLSSLDVSRNTALTFLSCVSNQLTDLNISQNTALKTLGCGLNALTALDVSQNTSLEELHCSINQLKDLNISQNTALTSLRCHDNQLTRLDVSPNTALNELLCQDNRLTELNMRGIRSLLALTLDPLQINASSSDANPLTSLKVHENLKDHAEIKEAKTNRGDALVIETYSAEEGSKDYTRVCADYDPNVGACLVTVTFQTNEGSEVDQQKVDQGQPASRPQAPIRDGYTFLGWFTDSNFQKAFAFDTPITENVILYARWEQIPEKFWIPDANFRKELKRQIPEAFDDQDSLITEHEQVSQRTQLKVFGTFGLEDLTGIAYFTALEELDCSGSQLTSLDVSRNTALEELDCSSNQLTSLDVSSNTALTLLNCVDNKLTGLDVSRNTALKTLGCGLNELTALDVSQNTVLTDLDCSTNKLTSLDVSSNTALTTLRCSGNQLTSLDVSQHTALTWLTCQDNLLTELNMRGVRSLTLLVDPLKIDATATSNPLKKLLVHENLQDHAEIKKAKTNRGDALVIETYRAEEGSTDYTRVCADYDPNDGDEGKCLKADSE